jgi:hypothetical protein
VPVSFAARSESQPTHKWKLADKNGGFAIARADRPTIQAEQGLFPLEEAGPSLIDTIADSFGPIRKDRREVIPFKQGNKPERPAV